MLASVLNSHRAIEVSVHVVRAFVRLREMLSAHKEVSRKLSELEKKVKVMMNIFEPCFKRSAN